MVSIGPWDTWEVLELKRNYDYLFNFFTILIASVKISVKLRACGDKKHVLGARRLADKAALDHAFMMRAY